MKRFILILVSCMTVMIVNAQDTPAPDEVFIGKWIGKDTGINITATSIQLLYKNGKIWELSNWEHEAVSFLDTAIHNDKKTFVAWGQMSSQLRAYLTSGGEESTYFASFSVYKIELINANTIRLSQSRPIKVVRKAYPVPTVITAEMKAAFGNKYERVIVLKKL